MQKVNFSWEILIADDCSTDATTSIINEYQQKHPHLIKILPRTHNLGAGKNFVDLINSATGTYIAYLEGDDYWLDENKLQIQYDYMQANPSFSMCYHQINWADHTVLVIDHVRNISNQNDEPITTLDSIVKNGWSIKSGTMFFKNIKLDADFYKLYIGDYPLHILLAKQGNIGFIKKVMGVYRMNYSGYSETQLKSTNIEKLKKLFRGNLYLNDYLNKITDFVYSDIFCKRKTNAAIIHLKTLGLKNFKYLPKEFLVAVTNIGFFNFLKYALKQFLNKNN